MAYDLTLAERVRTFLKNELDIEEKKMFGGLAFMVDNHMCIGVRADMLMARIDPDLYNEALAKPFVKKMDFTGKPLKGFIYIEAKGIETDERLSYWINLSFEFVKSLPPKTK